MGGGILSPQIDMIENTVMICVSERESVCVCVCVCVCVTIDKVWIGGFIDHLYAPPKLQASTTLSLNFTLYKSLHSKVFSVFH
jgi:hypothetical protein